MQTEIIAEPEVLINPSTLGQPQRAVLPALGHKMAQVPERPLENLEKIARRFSNIRPTAESRKSLAKHLRTNALTRPLKGLTRKRIKQKIYDRLSWVFD